MTEGFRTVFKEDIGTTVSELVYRTTIKLPGECVEESNPKTNEHEFVQQLRTHFHSIRPVHTSNHSKQSPFVFKDLQTCSHVLVRVDSVRSPLQKPYTGPYMVKKRFTKNFILDIGGKSKTISIDRLKPAFVYNHEDFSTERGTPPNNESYEEKTFKRTTRSGRRVHSPKHFISYKC